MVKLVTDTFVPEHGTDLTLRDLSWFSQRVERGRKETFVEIVTITPDIAKRLLEANASNRSASAATVNAIVHDIKNKRWRMNGETIIVSEDGELNDGQCRLLATVRAGIPIQSAVIFGVSRNSRMTVDMGRSRSAAQFLAMLGMSSASKIASIARLQLVLETGMARSSGSITKQDTLKVVEERQSEIMMAYKQIGASRFASAVSGCAPLSVAWMSIRKVDSVHGDIFFESLASGVGLETDDPVLWLRAKLFEIANKRATVRAEDKLEMLLRYWNSWADQKSGKGGIKMSGVFPKVHAAKPRV